MSECGSPADEWADPRAGSRPVGHLESARRLIAGLPFVGVLGACAGPLPDQFQACSPKQPSIEWNASKSEASTKLSVLIYNVEGLPWPARQSRTPQLRQIALELAVMRRDRRGPDVVLLQEAFTREAALIGVKAGYGNRVKGPGPRAKADEDGPIPNDFRQERSFWKGERLPKQLSSGLYLLSEYPVTAVFKRPFESNACAGYDCLANKGVMLARLSIPGVPTPIDVFNTHMNSQKASGVPVSRSVVAHRLQTDASAKFIARSRANAYPLIFGGDFNMRGSPDRFSHFRFRKPFNIVRHYCTQVVSDCDVRMSWDGDEPWMDTQDLQGFDDGALVRVRPVKVEAMFDGPWRGRQLADHDGYLVTYRLSWPASAVSRTHIPPCEAGDDNEIVTKDGGSLNVASPLR